jgi:hypothetical protein
MKDDEKGISEAEEKRTHSLTRRSFLSAVGAAGVAAVAPAIPAEPVRSSLEDRDHDATSFALKLRVNGVERAFKSIRGRRCLIVFGRTFTLPEQKKAATMASVRFL